MTLRAVLYDDDGNQVGEMPVAEDYLWLVDLTPRDEDEPQPEVRHRTWREWGDCDAKVIHQGGFWRPITIEDAEGRSKHARMRWDGEQPYLWATYPRKWFGKEWRFSQDDDDDEDMASFHVNPQDLPREFNALKRQWKDLACQVIRIIQDIADDNGAERRKKLKLFLERQKIRHPLLLGFVLVLQEFCTNASEMNGRDRQRAVQHINDAMGDIHEFMWGKYEKLVQIVMAEQKIILEHKRLQASKEKKKNIDEGEWEGADDEVLVQALAEAGIVDGIQAIEGTDGPPDS